MFGLADARIEDSYLPRVGCLLIAHLAEERCEAVVVVHRPAVEGMIVALRALDARAEKRLSNILCQKLRRGFGLVITRCRIGECPAARWNRFGHNLVNRSAGANLLAQPLIIESQTLRAHAIIGADLEELSPPHHPQIEKFFAFHECVDELVTLVGGLIAEKRSSLFGCRQQTDKINAG